MNTDKSDRYVERVRLAMEREEAVLEADEAGVHKSLRDLVMCVCVCAQRIFEVVCTDGLREYS